MGCCNDIRAYGDVPLYNSVLSVTGIDDVDTEPLSVEDFKAFAKIDTTDEDALIASIISASRIMCESATGLGFVARTGIVATIAHADGSFLLPYGPVTGTPTATDEDEEVIEISFKAGRLKEPLGTLIVTYDGGYSTLPAQLLNALKAQALFLYENRGDATQSMSPIASQILKQHRVVV